MDVTMHVNEERIKFCLYKKTIILNSDYVPVRLLIKKSGEVNWVGVG